MSSNNNNEQPEEMEILWKATLAKAMSSILPNMQKFEKKNHWANCCNARIIGENQMTEDYVIESVTKEVGKKTVKAEVQNGVKKIRNKEEQVNEKMKKNKQKSDDDGSMDVQK